jgi:hypothetical protein
MRFEDSLGLVSFTCCAVNLPAQSQPAHYLVVSLDVNPLQVIEQTAALRDHLQQTSARMIILLVYLEMLGEFVDALT